MKKVIHLMGSQCSGKSHLLRELKKKHGDISIFCLAETFYKKHGILNSTYNMDWDSYRSNISKLPQEVATFIESSEIPIIESSGLNDTLEYALSDFEVIEVALEPPDDYDLEWRAKERNIDFKTAKEIRRQYLNLDLHTVDYDQAMEMMDDGVKFLRDNNTSKAVVPSINIDSILSHRNILKETDWKSDEFWHLPINVTYDPWDVDKREYFFDKETAIRVVEFWERTFIHSSGEWQGLPFILEPWQKQVIGHFFGWKQVKASKDVQSGEEIHLRRYREAFFYIPRKNGKTPLGVCLALIMYRFDGELGAEVDIMAADKQQAGIAWGDLSYNIENVPIFKADKLYKDHPDHINLFRSQQVVEHAATASYARVLSADAETKHGYRPSCYLIDELHLQKNEELMETMETGTAARRQPTAIYITTADYDHPSPCNQKLAYAESVIMDPKVDPEFFPVIYRADENDDPMDEGTWLKANPNYGVSCKPEYFKKKARKAQKFPRFMNTFKRLHLNIKTGQAVRWLSKDSWRKCGEIIPIEELQGQTCYGAIDLASVYDCCSFSLFFPEYMYLIHNFWVPEARVHERLEYQVWKAGGFLKSTPGKTTDYNFIKKEVIEAAKKFNILDIAFDNYNATHFVKLLIEYDNIQMARFGQTMKFFNEPSKRFEQYIENKMLRHDNNPVAEWMAGNVEVKEDTEGNIKPIKPPRGGPAKIDGVITDIMAIGIWMNDELEGKYISPVVSYREEPKEDEEDAESTDSTTFEDILNDDMIWND